jgi:hypothetical protein
MTFEVTVPSSGSIAFWYRVSSENGFDFLHFYVDDVEIDSWSGDMPWIQATYVLAPGTHLLR